MKKILFLLLIATSAKAQTYTNTILVGATNSVSVGGTVYPLDVLAMAFTYNQGTYMGLVNTSTGKTVLYGKPVRYYKHPNGTSFADSAALMSFYTDSMVSGSGGTVTVPQNRIPYGSATNEITSSSNFQWDNATGTLSTLNTDINLSPDGTATVWGSPIVTQNNISNYLPTGSFTYTSGSTSVSNTIPAGYTKAIITVANTGTPTRPFGSDQGGVASSYKIVGTTLTVYLIATQSGTAVAEDYLVTYLLIP